MAEFRKMIITASGKELLSKVVAESANFAFTKVVLSAQDYADNEIVLLEQLSDIRQELPLYKVLRAEDSTIEVTAVLDNSDVSDGYQYASIGLYAQIADEPETLFAACGSDAPGYIPSKDSQFRILLNLQIGFSNCDSISLVKKLLKLPYEQLKADWCQTDKESPDYIKNKPNITTGEQASIGIGDMINATGEKAVAAGYGLSSTDDKQVLLGQLNAPNKSAVLIVGNGFEDRRNAITVQKDGSITVGGHYVDDAIRPNICGVDSFSNYSAGEEIGIAGDKITGNVVISDDDLKCEGLRSATFNVNGQELPWLGPQTNIERCYVTAGDTYTLSMKVYPYSDNQAVPVRMWVAAIPEGQEQIQLGISDIYLDYVIEWYDMSDLINGQWNDLAVEITPERSGVIRIGFSDYAVSNKYAVGAVVLKNNSPPLPTYNYSSVGYENTKTLYCVDDVPCATECIREWLVGRTLVTEYGAVIITEDMVSNEIAHNYIVRYTTGNISTIIMCIVDGIVHGEKCAPRLGMYISNSVIEVPCRRWVDDPFYNSPLPAVTADDNEKILQVVDGKWSAVRIENLETNNSDVTAETSDGVLVLSGSGLSAEISDDVLVVNIGSQPAEIHEGVLVIL